MPPILCHTAGPNGGADDGLGIQAIFFVAET